MQRPFIFRLHERIGRRFRAQRMRAFAARFGLTEQTTVLDVGGSVFNWTLVDTRPDLTIINLPIQTPRPGVKWIVGDARDMPFEDQSFDIVFSNSVIEHMGTAEDQQRLADEVRRVGKSYWVQTPNYWFPIEPHYLTPFVHWLPKSVRVRLLRNVTAWGWITRPTPAQSQSSADEIRLLTRGELQRLFPDAEIITERVLGLPKSLTAIRRVGESNG